MGIDTVAQLDAGRDDVLAKLFTLTQHLDVELAHPVGEPEETLGIYVGADYSLKKFHKQTRHTIAPADLDYGAQAIVHTVMLGLMHFAPVERQARLQADIEALVYMLGTFIAKKYREASTLEEVEILVGPTEDKLVYKLIIAGRVRILGQTGRFMELPVIVDMQGSFIEMDYPRDNKGDLSIRLRLDRYEERLRKLGMTAAYWEELAAMSSPYRGGSVGGEV